MSFASLRTRGVAASPAWKMASTNRLAARRRGWVRGRHTRTSGIRSDLSGLAKRLSPQSRTRRRAARTLTLATFHAGPAAASSVRRDTQAHTCWRQVRGPVQPTGSAGKMPRLGPGRDAQASERGPACPSWGAHAGTYRRRGGSEGRFPRNKGSTEREATLASAVATAPVPHSGEEHFFARAPGRAGPQRLRWLIATLPRIRPQAMPIGQVSASPSRPQAQATAASGTR